VHCRQKGTFQNACFKAFIFVSTLSFEIYERCFGRIVIAFTISQGEKYFHADEDDDDDEEEQETFSHFLVRSSNHQNNLLS